MAPSLRPYDVLLCAIYSATSELELVDIRALIAHRAGGALEEIDGLIAARRRASAARDQRAPSLDPARNCLSLSSQAVGTEPLPQTHVMSIRK